MDISVISIIILCLTNFYTLWSSQKDFKELLEIVDDYHKNNVDFLRSIANADASEFEVIKKSVRSLLDSEDFIESLR